LFIVYIQHIYIKGDNIDLLLIFSNLSQMFKQCDTSIIYMTVDALYCTF
jgi:hypothetical protein